MALVSNEAFGFEIVLMAYGVYSLAHALMLCQTVKFNFCPKRPLGSPF